MPQHELRYRWQVVLSVHGVGVHNRFLPWAQVRSLRWDPHDGHPVVVSDDTGRRWRDTEIGRVIEHYLSHPTDRRLLEFTSHAVPPLPAE